MRDYKFRGRKGNGEWVYGYLLKEPNDTGTWRYLIQDIDNLGCQWEIDENTIGEYTGLKDKNGKEIYEGDVVIGMVDLFGSRSAIDPCKVLWDEKRCQFSLYGFAGTGISRFDDLQVIGNIYENPELLKGSE